MTEPAYDSFPHVMVPDSASACVAGWDAIAERLRTVVALRGASRCVLVIDCYPGIDETRIGGEIAARLRTAAVFPTGPALLPPNVIDALAAPFLGNDPVFGRKNGLTLDRFFSAEKISAIREKIGLITAGLVVVVGCGACLIHPGDVLVYADLARREAQLRQRRGEIGNLGAGNPHAASGLKYKRAFYVDWPVADRHKHPLVSRWDFVLDMHDPRSPKLAEGAAVRRGLREAAHRPFRVVPYFDPAPWGGQWLREQFKLDPGPANYGWGFDCVPEENSLLLGFGEHRVEIPASNLVVTEPEALLGDDIHRRFGAEFPIRFDFLDTMGGGHLSFQVHPLKEYIRQMFGMPYTQDESYYLLAAKPGAGVYLGLKDGVSPDAMMQALGEAQTGGAPFPADRFSNLWPARAHDHFLIPAGTIHCSGRDCVVLEISATPFNFTFKLWDWARPGLDGRPRPVHLDHGAGNIQWDRTTDWVRKNLVNRIEPLASGADWREERTGLHELEFIETRRHWFTGPTPHDTAGTLNVLNLVQGRACVVESPEGRFAPFPVNYAETFIVPAAVGPYTVRPLEAGQCATIKAFVRPEAGG